MNRTTENKEVCTSKPNVEEMFAYASQEPVAYMYQREDGVGVLNFDRNFALMDKGYKEVPLYTHDEP